MEERAQGAIEYLLIIAAAVLVVAIVVMTMTQIVQKGTTQNDNAGTSYDDQVSGLNDLIKGKPTS